MAAKRPNAAAAAGAAKAAAAPKGKADAGSGQPPAKKAKNLPAANGTAEPQKQHVAMAPAAQQEQATVGPSSAAAAAKAALLKQRLFKHQKGNAAHQHAADGAEQQPDGSAPKQQRPAGKAKWQNKKKHAGQQQQQQPAQAAKVPAPASDIPAGPAGAAAAAAAATAGTVAVHNKERVLVLTTRGITFRYRHLMEDLVALLPHSKKDVKLDTKSDRGVINEVADLKGCSSVLFFEARKRQDLYLWMAKSPAGPSVKFLVANVHTMAEVKLAGNHLKGSRPVLSFHRAFDEQPHLQLLKEMLTQVFATPRRHHKGKPFFDHVLSFAVADGRIWMRNYQVVVPLEKKKADVDNTSLIEVGPRFCLNPIKIFSGSFGGAVLYENTNYVSPNALRAAAKRAAAAKYVNRVEQRQQRKQHEAEHQMPRDPLDGLFKGEGEEEDGGSE